MSVQYPTQQVDELLSIRDYGTIIHDKQLFLITFLKASILSNLSKLESYNIFFHDKQIGLHSSKAARKEIPEKAIPGEVEIIRQHLLEGHKTKHDVHLVPIVISLREICIKKRCDIINLTNWNSDHNERINYFRFSDLIKPTLPKLCSLLGARCLFKPVIQQYREDQSGGIEQKNVEAIDIEWIREEHVIYSIAPQEIPSRELNSLVKSTYDMYQNSICCDFIIGIGEVTIPVHSIPFYTYGGDAIKNMLTTNMKEQQERKIEIKEFKEKTVRAFIDFIYLGPKGLNPESDRYQELDVIELFRMAQTYQVKDLIDHCANLMSLYCTSDQADNIEEMADYYQNDYLKKLSEHLKKQPNS